MRKVTETSILTDEEVARLAEQVEELLGDHMGPLARSAGVDLEDLLRFSAVAEKCRLKREEMGLGLKEAAKEIRAPQYRLKAIEENQISSVTGPVLASYIDFLGLHRWYGRWARAHRALHERLDVPPEKKRKKR